MIDHPATMYLQYWIIVLETTQVITFFFFCWMIWQSNMAARVFPDVKDSLISIAESMWDKSKYFEGHGRRVSLMCAGICDAMRIRGIDRSNIVSAGLLHDIGKLYMDDSVLHSSEKLTDAQWESMRLHTVKGSSLLKRFPTIHSDIVTSVLYSHENIDGSGYPLQLSGTSIPLGARIIRVADSIDSMVMGRAYKKPLNWTEAMQDLKDHSGTWYDEEIIKLCTTNGLSRRLRLIMLNNR